VLSYRHSFHAGNHADVLKHVVLVDLLQYLLKKDKPLDYIDTHAGAGLYSLSGHQSAKTQEYLGGIGRLEPNDWPELSDYLSIVNSCQIGAGLSHYPGSPEIAQRILRRSDRRWLFELHPHDAALLSDHYQGLRHTRVEQTDGLKGLLSLLPPASKRALVLIDPSYEIKEDYVAVIKAVIKAWTKFRTGVYAIWYPVVDRTRIDDMEARLKRAGVKSVQRFELAVLSDSAGRGMTGSGMIVINPPWTLFSRMEQLLPKLSEALGETGQASFRCDVIAKE
jgi:23S rRNA (adenine2030-N6)-methyltransferase